MLSIASQPVTNLLLRWARLLAVSMFVVACGGDNTGSAGPPLPPVVDGPAAPPSLVSIIVVGIPATPMTPGQSAKLTAKARYTDGSLRDVTSSVAWSSSDTSVLTIPGTAVIKAAAPGRAEVIATRDAVSGRASVRVSLEGGRIELFAGVLTEPDTSCFGVPCYGFPYGVTIDHAGNLYFADNFTNQIRQITSAGQVSTLAGTGRPGSHDGGATEAEFSKPSGMAIDDSGALYVADTANHTIRKIAPTGLVTTLAGVAGEAGSADGVGAAARFNSPEGVATDGAGNVFVADTANHLIRKITPEGEVSTLAGNGQPGSVDGPAKVAGFYYPRGVAVNLDGTVAVAEVGSVRKITTAGQVSRWVNVYFADPYGLVFDTNGTLYVAETGNNSVRKISQSGEVTVLAGQGAYGVADGVGSNATFRNPRGLAIDPALNVYVADSGNNSVRKITPASEVTTIAAFTPWRPADGVGAAAHFGYPYEIAADGNGNLYVADAFWLYANVREGSIRRITPTARVTTFRAVGGGFATKFSNPSEVSGLTADPAGGILYAALNSFSWTYESSNFASDILKFAQADEQLMRIDFNVARLVMDRAGNLYTCSGHAISKISLGGGISTFAGMRGESGSADGTGTTARFSNPRGLAIDPSGNLYVADSGNHTIRRITSAGQVSTLAGLPGQAGYTDGLAEESRFTYPDAIATDSDGNVYVGDNGSGVRYQGGASYDTYSTTVIRKVTPMGVVTTVAGKAGQIGFAPGPLPGVLSPRGLAVSGTSLYVTLYYGIAVVTNVR